MNQPAPVAVRPTSGSPRKPWWRRWFGNRSERAATRFLKRLGYRIVACNYTTALGELDVIAMDQAVVVFVEVRSTETGEIERPAHSVDAAKQRQLTTLSLQFLQKHRLMGRPARFDVLAVSWPSGQREPKIVHYRHAFEAVGRFQMDS
jgi:putative endonuclease